MMISCAVVEIATSSVSSVVGGDVVLVMNARFDAAANEARGVDDDDDAHDGCSVVVATARRREMLNLMLA